MPQITKGMQNVMNKLPGSDKQCPNCGFIIPKYTGAYPKKCPDCGALLSTPKAVEALNLINSVFGEQPESKK